MATTVAFSDLDNWLRSQPLNSRTTPYEIEITGLTAGDLGERTTSGSLGYILYQNYNKYVDLSSTTLPVVTSLLHSFLNCSNIVKPPIIPEGVQSIYDAFAGCTYLTEITLPTTIDDIRNAFSNCTNLSKIKWNINDNMVIRGNSEYAFEYCSNLTDFYCDSPHTIKNYLTEISTSARLPTSVSSCNFYLFSEVAEIPFSSLNDELGVLSTNTTSTPYKIKVTGLTSSDITNSAFNGTLGYTLIQNFTKYVDLSETSLPIVTNMDSTFKGCSSLVNAPVIPSDVTSMNETFRNCTSLVNAPVIPNGVTSMVYTFYNCTSLVNAPIIPDSVTDMSGAFWSCTSLVNAPVIPGGVTNMSGTFRSCTSLVNAFISLDSAVDLYAAFLNCTSLTTIKIESFDLSKITDYSNVFNSCNNLTEFYSNTPYELKSGLDRIHSNNPSNFPNDVANCHFYLYSEPAEIPISNLENTLSVIETNTISTPYKIKVTELTTTEIENRSIRYALTRNATKDKYVDLSETVLPNGVESLEQQFSVCNKMTKSPKLPQGVVNLKETFAGCSSLMEAPLIPDTVENMYYTFRDCYNYLVTPPVIPEGVTNLTGCFYNCRVLLTPPRIPNSAEIVTRMFYGCWALTQMPNIPTTVLNIQEMFYECRALTEVTIPSHITNISNAFRGCISLETVTIESPSSITNCANGFYGCTSLATVNIKSFDSTNIDSYNYVFGGCTNLTEFYCDEPYNLKTWLNTIYTESTSHFPNDVANCHFYLYSEPAEISITTLSDDLSALTGNTTSTPFEIKVTDLTSSNLGDLNTALTNNSTKFVDISETVLPSGMLSASSVFSGCVSLIKAPVIPDSVTIMVGTFENCSNLAEAPDIPDGVTSIRKAFSGCSSITSIEKVSSTVTNLSEAFKNCSSLESIEEFDVPLSVLKTNAQDCFDGCTSLTTVGVQGVAPITEASEWHVIRLNFGADNVSGKVYDKDKNTTTIPQTTVQKGTLTLPIKTDELWFPPASMLDADIDAVIESVIDARLTYFNKPVLNPNNKSFVLWKGDNSNFVSNIDFGGSGGGADITVYDTLEDLEEDLPNHDIGDFLAVDSDYFIDKERLLDDVTTLAHDEIINILKNAVSVPIGTILSIPSSGVVSGYLQCNGGTFNELDYPLLYGALRTNILPKKWNAEEWVINQEILTEETFFGKPVYSFSFYDDRTRSTSWVVCTPNGETYFPYEHNIKKIVKVECSSAHTTTYRNGIVENDLYQITNTTLDSTTQEYIPSATSQLYVYYGHQSYWSANDRVLRTIYYTKLQDDENRFSWKYIKAVSGVEEEESATVVNAIQDAEQALEQTVIDTADSIMATAIDNYFKEYVLAEATVTPTSGAQAVNANTVFNDSLLNYRTVRFYMKRNTGNTDYIPHYDVTHEEMVNYCARNTNYSLLIPGYASEYREMTFNADGTVCTAAGGSECCYKVIGIGKLN